MCPQTADSVLKADFDVLVPGAHRHDMDRPLDAPTYAPADEAAFNEKHRELEARKSEAIATDDLERALHLNNAISVLKSSPRI